MAKELDNNGYLQCVKDQQEMVETTLRLLGCIPQLIMNYKAR